FRHADLEDRHNRISFHTWIDAKWRDIAIRRNHPQRIADGKAEIFRHTGADGNTATLVKTFQRTLTDIAGNKLELVEVFFTQAAHESAGSSADIALHKRLPFHHGNGEPDTGNAVDPLDERGIIIQRTINRLHDEMTVYAKNSGQKLGTEAV